jgi:hypothetical protein
MLMSNTTPRWRSRVHGTFKREVVAIRYFRAKAASSIVSGSATVDDDGCARRLYRESTGNHYRAGAMPLREAGVVDESQDDRR